MSHQIRDSDGGTGQQTLTAFARNTPGDESGDLWEFDEYGPTMGRPIPRGVFDQLPGTGLDERELIGTGLSASDWDRCKTRSTSDGELYHLEDRDDPPERDRFREMMKTQENSEDSEEEAEDGESPESKLHSTQRPRPSAKS